MESVAIVIMVLVCFNFLLKQTNRKPLFIALSAVVCALFVGLMWGFAIEQSKTRISDLIADTTLMLDIAVVMSIDVILQMTYCISAARIQTEGRLGRFAVWGYRLLRWYPGVLVFPVLFCLLVAVVFASPGVSFSLVAWSLAGVVLVAVPVGTYALKYLLPEKNIRIELLFLSNALLAILGITATVNGRTAVAGSSDVDWAALAGVALLVLAGIFVGTFIYKLKSNKKINHELHF